jgi:hypothetical protein
VACTAMNTGDLSFVIEEVRTPVIMLLIPALEKRNVASRYHRM